MPHLEAIAGLMKDQLTLAKEAGHEVKVRINYPYVCNSTCLIQLIARKSFLLGGFRVQPLFNITWPED